ncbi:hypothetical protein QBL07_000370 (plasmid) [Gordonia rubripertincta]|uniref:hypothetical protein n=2 Tax=Gordonia TaxID=2053 RepID=UPI002436EC6B|nr:hypothetical protein [Gordonia rubripertincta]
MASHSTPSPGPARAVQEVLLLELIDALLRLDPEPAEAFARDLHTFDTVAAAPGDFVEMIDPASARSQLKRDQPRLRMLLAILRSALTAVQTPAPGEHTVAHYYRRAAALVTETEIGARRYSTSGNSPTASRSPREAVRDTLSNTGVHNTRPVSPVR